ncbi:hypothetical protein KEM54_006920 [Ascosphaera aggregata]|nr:hypothetical protein KEM54_006920 [Ascosphaera aggregata]
MDIDLEKAEGRGSDIPQRVRSNSIESGRTARTSSSSIGTSTSSDQSPHLFSGQNHHNGVASLSRSREHLSRTSTRQTLDNDITALSRIATQRSQHTGTVGADPKSLSREESRPLPPFGRGKPYPPPLPSSDEYVVEFDGPNDPLHPQNWGSMKKFFTAVMLCWTTINTSFSSSVFSAGEDVIGEYFGVSKEVTTLGVTLFVIGFATGPIIWAPFSELKGRKLPLIIGMLGFTCFQFGAATAKDLQTLTLCRFFSGFFGGSPFAIVGAVFSDIYDNDYRGVAVTFFSIAVFCGPMAAPFIGGYIVDSYLGWRWLQYLTAITGSSALALDVFVLQESYAPIILCQKAAELRRRTKNWGIHAKQEEIEVDLHELVHKNFSRPLRILFTEPIILFISIYMSFIYGLLYLFLTAYPLIFQQKYGMSKGVAGLTMIGIIVGMFFGGVAILSYQPTYRRKLRANNNVPIPEWRLIHVMAGGFAFSAGLFWLGWAGYTGKVHWIVPTLSGLLSGFGLLCIFQQLMNYIIDAYLVFAASAIAGNTFMRSITAGAFPLFATYMFNGMGIQWACTLLGCFATILVPIPFVLNFWGAKIRAKSKFAMDYTADINKAQEEALDENVNDLASAEERPHQT